MKLRNIALTLSLMLAAGCASKATHHSTAVKTPARDTARLGPVPAAGHAIVRVVNTEDKFVVIDFTARSMPANGAHLDVYRLNKKVGTVRTTEPARSGFSAADILEGEVRVGDEVR